MAENRTQNQDQAGAQGNTQASNPGRSADSLSGTPETGAGQSQQSAAGGSSAGHYTGGAGAGSSRESGFVHTSAESNVGPAGAPQSSRGSAGGAIPGGTQGAAAPGTSLDEGIGAAAGGGRPGTSADTANAPIEGARGGPGGDDSLVKKLGDPGADMPDGSDSR